MTDSFYSKVTLVIGSSVGVSYIDVVEPAMRIISLAVGIYVSIAMYRRKSKEKNNEPKQ